MTRIYGDIDPNSNVASAIQTETTTQRCYGDIDPNPCCLGGIGAAVQASLRKMPESRKKELKAMLEEMDKKHQKRMAEQHQNNR